MEFFSGGDKPDIVGPFLADAKEGAIRPVSLKHGHSRPLIQEVCCRGNTLHEDGKH
jgi:hypothetical protein